MIIQRRKTKEIKIGTTAIGARHPIAIQSMAKVPTKNYREAISQIQSLEKVGCAIVRVAILDEEDAHAITRIKNAIRIPLVADIHFNWKLAVCAIKAGADKIRLNPGNIYKKQEVKEITSLAREYAIPIRVGLNSGSIPKIFRYNAKLRPALKLVRAALDYVKMLEDIHFNNIVVSLKCSNVLDTIEAYQAMAEKCGYPLHLGLTATGFSDVGKIKSAVALGILLSQGIGDTLRVSLTDRPEEEIRTALKNAKNIAVIDKSISLGTEGILATEIKRSIGDSKNTTSFIVGLGGRDITKEMIKNIYQLADKHQEKTVFIGK